MKSLILICAVGIGTVIGYLYALSRQSGVPIVFNTQPVWTLMKPHTSPIIEMPDEQTVVIHRPPNKWFNVSCLEWGETYIRPNYSSRQCWPTRYEKLLREEDWPKVGEVKCEWKGTAQ